MKRLACALIGMAALVVGAAVIGLTSCTTSPLLAADAIQLEVAPATEIHVDPGAATIQPHAIGHVEAGAVAPVLNIAPDAIHIEPGAVQLTTTPTLTVEPGAVVVTVEVPVDKAAAVLSPVIERVTRSAVADVVKANRLIGRDANQTAGAAVGALAAGLSRLELMGWVLVCCVALLCGAGAWLAIDRARGNR